MSVQKSKPSRLPRMFERKHIENIARARDLVREARELIHQSKELVEETKGALASSKQRECKQASKQASITGSPGHLLVMLERL